MLFKFYVSHPGHTDQSDFTLDCKADIIDFIKVVLENHHISSNHKTVIHNRQKDNSRINYAVFVFGHDSKRSRKLSRKLHNKLIQFEIDASDETIPRQDVFSLK